MHNFYLIGHRGAAGEKFENSMSGFEHALTLDIDAIELDIHQHAGELWVIHDQELDRLTDATGKFQALDDPSTLRLKNGEPIPRLREVLDLLWGKIPLNIEIKSFNTGPMLLQLLEQYAPVEQASEFPWILISSFDHRQILALRQASCPWSLALASRGIPVDVKHLIETVGPFSWSMDREYLDYDFIKQVQQQGVQVMIFTVNETSQALELKNAGIDGIFTDYPSKLLGMR
ncbi:MAG: glycerophosphodiester phosphodiesterase [Gammaproteobacteria bacterium]|nr:glycerophosphodiester phosphodiesterase [Gammaproteobacteria bacterium]